LGLAVPIAVYLLGVWALHLTPGRTNPFQLFASPLAAVLVLASTRTPWPLPLIALLMAARVVVEIVAPQGVVVEIVAPQGAEQGEEASHGAAFAAQTDASRVIASDERR